MISSHVKISMISLISTLSSWAGLYSIFSPPIPYHYPFACSLIQSYTNKYLSADCVNLTFAGSFVRGINEIRILIRQPYFNIQTRLLNE